MVEEQIGSVIAMTEPTREVVELSDEQCWELLGRTSLGRLAFHVGDEVHITPVNHVVRGGQILFRTAAGNKLVAVVVNPDVAFEVEELDLENRRAASVVVRGVASRLGPAELRALGAEGPHPLVTRDTFEVVAIRPTSVTGRSFTMEDA